MSIQLGCCPYDVSDVVLDCCLWDLNCEILVMILVMVAEMDEATKTWMDCLLESPSIENGL